MVYSSCVRVRVLGLLLLLCFGVDSRYQVRTRYVLARWHVPVCANLAGNIKRVENLISNKKVVIFPAGAVHPYSGSTPGPGSLARATWSTIRSH